MEKKIKFNWFDGVIILLVVASIFVVYQVFNRQPASSGTTIQYTFELIENREGFSDLISVGDEIIDNIGNHYMGEVIAVEKTPHTIISYDKEIMVGYERVVGDKETTLITVETEIIDDGVDLKTPTGYLIRCGLSIAVRGEDFAGRGYVLSIDRDTYEEEVQE